MTKGSCQLLRTYCVPATVPVFHTSSAALTAICKCTVSSPISQLEKQRPREVHQHGQGHRARQATQHMRHQVGMKRPEPQRTTVLHAFSNSFKLLRKITPNLEARQRNFCMRCQYLTLEQGLANDGVRAKWPNALFGKEGLTGTSPPRSSTHCLWRLLSCDSRAEQPWHRPDGPRSLKHVPSAV